MKMKIHPAVMTTILVVVIGVVAVLLFRAATEKPKYPGWDVGPGGGPPMTQEDGKKMKAAMDAMKAAKEAGKEAPTKGAPTKEGSPKAEPTPSPDKK
jgi:hypothetical protein